MSLYELPCRAMEVTLDTEAVPDQILKVANPQTFWNEDNESRTFRYNQQ